LDGDDLCGVEALESAVDVFDLHDSCADEDGNEQVEDWKRDGTPERV
jgi:hypothetical protein